MTKYIFPFAEKDIPKGGEFGNHDAPRTNAHRGVDGPPEFAVAVTDAVVVVNKWSTVLGNVVVIQDEKGTFWGYNHLRDASPLEVGTRVKCGDRLGVVGNTGSASRGRHLHFTCSNHIDGNQQGKVFDPFEILKKRMAVEAAKSPKPVVKAAVVEAKPVEKVAADVAPAKKSVSATSKKAV